MLASLGKLDSLVGAIFPIADYEAAAEQSFTLTGTVLNQTVATMKVQIIPGTGIGGENLPGGGNTVVAVNDTTNTLTVQVYNLNGTILNFTLYVLGFTSNAILVSGNSSNTIAILLGSGLSIDYDLGVLSDAPIAAPCSF